ncbi:hypothetical protein BJY01DRAFT_246380 [Aspergillus pseudoustus]|uniref:Uncharacterized protein n=1 Tax=Aspergillus pseudoustus TaxID=1810923 RepID=A0ABR4K881_9EURO
MIQSQAQPVSNPETIPLFIAIFPWVCLRLSVLFIAIFYWGCIGEVSRSLSPRFREVGTTRERATYRRLLDEGNETDTEGEDISCITDFVVYTEGGDTAISASSPTCIVPIAETSIPHLSPDRKKSSEDEERNIMHPTTHSKRRRKPKSPNVQNAEDPTQISTLSNLNNKDNKSIIKTQLYGQSHHSPTNYVTSHREELYGNANATTDASAVPSAGWLHDLVEVAVRGLQRLH